MTALPRAALYGGLVAVLAACFLASLAFGPAGLGGARALGALFGADDAAARLIVHEVRVPRALLAVAVGGSLGLAGAALQGFLRNPLAEPGIIGATSAAAAGAVFVFYSGLAGAFAWALPMGGIAGAMAAVGLVLLLAGRSSEPLTLILAGVAVTSFAGALTALALNLAPNPFAAAEIMFWLMGSLADRGFDQLWLALPFMVVGWALLLSVGAALDALTLGAPAAASLGFELGRVARRIVLGTALAVGAATAVAGAIGFVGLVTPHLLRPLVGRRPSALLPASALGGAALVLAADLAARLTATAEELKLGVLTALIGAPFFLYLIFQMRRSPS